MNCLCRPSRTLSVRIVLLDETDFLHEIKVSSILTSREVKIKNKLLLLFYILAFYKRSSQPFPFKLLIFFCYLKSAKLQDDPILVF